MNHDVTDAEIITESTPQMPEELSPHFNQIVAKRLLKQYGIKLAATVGVVTAVIIVANRFGNNEEIPTLEA